MESDTFTNGHRAVKECGQNQEVFFVTFTTNNYGDETSFQVIDPSGGIIGGGGGFEWSKFSGQYLVRLSVLHEERTSVLIEVE